MYVTFLNEPCVIKSKKRKVVIPVKPCCNTIFSKSLQKLFFALLLYSYDMNSRESKYIS